MSRKSRVQELEIKAGIDGLVAFEFVDPIIFEGVAYRSWQDIPNEIHRKNPIYIIVGHAVTSKGARIPIYMPPCAMDGTPWDDPNGLTDTKIKQMGGLVWR